MICEFIQKLPTFQGLTPATLAAIADKMWAEQHLAGATVIAPGDPGDTFYLVRHGEVELLRDDSAGKRKVATLGEGDSFGEWALLGGDHRHTTARTTKSTLLYALGKDDFESAINSSASFREELQKALFDRQ